MAPTRPWEGQILQLAAYCLLVEENYGVQPPYGILQYKDRAFAIEYTDELEDDLLLLLDEMRTASYAEDILPDHNQPAVVPDVVFVMRTITVWTDRHSRQYLSLQSRTVSRFPILVESGYN
ncbi:MAG: hypothetical protein R3C44_08005 [Chloroflexota bacterium]